MVEWKKLGDICNIKTGKGITQEYCSEEHLFPVISGGQTPMGYYSEYNRNENTVTVSRVGANAGYVSYLTEKFYLNDKCFSVIPHNQSINSKFLFFYLKDREGEIRTLQSEGGVPTINTQKLGKITFPIPLLTEQKRIVGILDTFTASIENLKEQIAQRRKQYEYYRDQLLDLEGKEGVEMKTLGEVCTVITGGEVPDDTIKGQLFPSPEYPYAVYTNGKETYGFTKTYQVDSDAVCISSIGANTGAIFYKVGKFTPAIRLKVLIPKKMLNTKFLYYAASIIDFRGKNTGSVPNINANYVKSKEIPVPPLSEQQRIVSILDTFEASIANLEAQLSQREKQYEYYRNKLLTFE